MTAPAATTVSASAPGKLFVLGEYAVLHGAPAVLAAVDARARVQARVAEDGQWRVHAPDVDVAELQLAEDGSLPDALPPQSRQALRVFDAVRATLAAELQLPPLQIDIDTHGFAGPAGKLGIGASAAVASALTGALSHTAGDQPASEALLQPATQAHNRAQNGEGSGADVATSIMGGVLVFAHGRAPETREWPSGLHALAVPTGDGADTPTLVGLTRRLAEADPAAHEHCIQPLLQLAQHGARALAQGEVARALTIADEYFDALATLGSASQAPIVTETHHQLRRIAARAGGVFKPTGAGGGDLGLVLAGSETIAAACAKALTTAGHPPVGLRFGAPGLQFD